MAKNSDVIVGFLAGAAIGAIAGILLAPEEGKETRRKLKEQACKTTKNASSTLESGYSYVRDKLGNIIGKIKSKTDGILEELNEEEARIAAEEE